MNFGQVMRLTMMAKKSLSQEEFAAWVDEMSTKLAGESLEAEQFDPHPRTYGCSFCRDTGYELEDGMSVIGSTITVAKFCFCARGAENKLGWEEHERQKQERRRGGRGRGGNRPEGDAE